jgi:hypothetical protein
MSRSRLCFDAGSSFCVFRTGPKESFVFQQRKKGEVMLTAASILQVILLILQIVSCTPCCVPPTIY